MRIDPVLEPEQLSQHPAALLLDVRGVPEARKKYDEAHLQGALFVDVERDLAGPHPDAAHGGRHPLPAVADFTAKLGAWGVTPSTHVVVYDEDTGGNAAARLWWMLRALGHEHVQLLDGGLRAARAAGLAINQQQPAARPTAAYPATHWQRPTVSIDQVEQLRQQPEKVLLDVRAAVRFRGEHEPIDPIAGHIPGAHNLFFGDNLRDDGRFKDAVTLNALYRTLLGDRKTTDLTVHCGSGVTACHTLLALERAGLDGASLYVGSWSEWCRNRERPRAP